MQAQHNSLDEQAALHNASLRAHAAAHQGNLNTHGLRLSGAHGMIPAYGSVTKQTFPHEQVEARYDNRGPQPRLQKPQSHLAAASTMPNISSTFSHNRVDAQQHLRRNRGASFSSTGSSTAGSDPNLMNIQNQHGAFSSGNLTTAEQLAFLQQQHLRQLQLMKQHADLVGSLQSHPSVQTQLQDQYLMPPVDILTNYLGSDGEIPGVPSRLQHSSVGKQGVGRLDRDVAGIVSPEIGFVSIIHTN